MKLQTSPTIDHKLLFQSLSAAYIVFGIDDPTFTIIEENEAHAEIAMQKRQNVVGRSLFDVFPDTSEKYLKTGESELLESIRKVIRTGKSDTMPRLSYDLKDQKGNMRQMYWTVSHHPVTDDEGKIVAVFQATKDITEEVLTRKQLDLTQYQLSQALSNGKIGTWVWNIKNGRVNADENLLHIFGFEEANRVNDILAEELIEAIHPSDKERVRSEVESAIKSKKLFESEYRTFGQGGAMRWVIARGKIESDESGKPVNFPGVVVDITDRKMAENNLKFLTAASTQFSASLNPKVTLNTIAKMVVPDIADWCSIDLFDGKTVERVATAHKDPAKIQWAEELYKKQGPPDMNQPTGLPHVLRTGEVEYYPEIPDEMLVAVAKDKAELKLMREVGFSSVIIVPMKLDNRVIGAISLITAESKIHYKESDIEVAKGFANRAALAVYNANLYQAAQREIKERRLLQRQLESANSVLESRVAERTRQLVDTNDGLEREIRRRLKIEHELQKYSKNLARSNQELQDFAYVASHDLQEPLRKIQAFGDLLESEYKDVLGDGVEYLSRMRSAASRMSVLIQDLLAFSRVTTKPQQIDQIDLNVIVQEVVGDLEMSIAEKQGQVTIAKLPAVWADATHMRQLFQNLIGNALKFHKEGTAPKVAVTVKPRSKDDTFYEIHVKDNGIGFEEKYLDRIFSVFQRLHGRDTYEGTGIGLAVCRKIVERYGGKIDATSKPNVGSTFIIKLPINHKEYPHDHS
ncbi:MAG TPA: ATP-binding protein [Candidatus Saccharimonadales bacterium]|jgi:PAS domain S-box-containing protein|nr:ATP-binding protein [Candidatus Saccharimonadales bacterium]